MKDGAKNQDVAPVDLPRTTTAEVRGTASAGDTGAAPVIDQPADVTADNGGAAFLVAVGERRGHVLHLLGAGDQCLTHGPDEALAQRQRLRIKGDQVGGVEPPITSETCGERLAITPSSPDASRAVVHGSSCGPSRQRIGSGPSRHGSGWNRYGARLSAPRGSPGPKDRLVRLVGVGLAAASATAAAATASGEYWVHQDEQSVAVDLQG
jgi:hypothetical protein